MSSNKWAKPDTSISAAKPDSSISGAEPDTSISAEPDMLLKRYVTSDKLGEDANSPLSQFPRCCEQLTSSLDPEVHAVATPPLLCWLCGAGFLSRQALYRHTRAAHGGYAEYRKHLFWLIGGDLNSSLPSLDDVLKDDPKIHYCSDYQLKPARGMKTQTTFVVISDVLEAGSAEKPPVFFGGIIRKDSGRRGGGGARPHQPSYSIRISRCQDAGHNQKT